MGLTRAGVLIFRQMYLTNMLTTSALYKIMQRDSFGTHCPILYHSMFVIVKKIELIIPNQKNKKVKTNAK